MFENFEETFVTFEAFFSLFYAGVDMFCANSFPYQYKTFRFQIRSVIILYLFARYGTLKRQTAAVYLKMCNELYAENTQFVMFYIGIITMVGITPWYFAWTLSYFKNDLPFIYLTSLGEVALVYGTLCFTQHWYAKFEARQLALNGRIQILNRLEQMNVDLFAILREQKNLQRGALLFDVKNVDCIICHEKIENDAAVQLPCKHEYCCACILKWFWEKKRFECPYCRQ